MIIGDDLQVLRDSALLAQAGVRMALSRDSYNRALAARTIQSFSRTLYGINNGPGADKRRTMKIVATIRHFLALGIATREATQAAMFAEEEEMLAITAVEREVKRAAEEKIRLEKEAILKKKREEEYAKELADWEVRILCTIHMHATDRSPHHPQPFATNPFSHSSCTTADSLF